jgi:hypothetical protein
MTVPSKVKKGYKDEKDDFDNGSYADDDNSIR